MTKTVTPNQPKNFNSSISANTTANDIEQHDEFFYSKLKPQLDLLIRNPSDESISKILAFAKGK